LRKRIFEIVKAACAGTLHLKLIESPRLRYHWPLKTAHEAVEMLHRFAKRISATLNMVCHR
jgi:hypothetical protein